MSQASDKLAAQPKEPAERAQPERKNLLVPDVERWGADRGPVISLKNVHKSFGDNHVIRDLSLDIEPGKITVIVGASGSGKSVLIKLMNGLYKADRGEVLLFGEDPAKLKPRELDTLRKRVGTLFQNYALFDSMSVERNVAFPLIEHVATSEQEAIKRAGELLTELELSHALKLMPSSLSGGMKKRVALARAIIANPEVVLFDEPTTGLDPIMMEFVDEMIRDINHRYGLTSVLISHDMASTFRLADHIAVLHEGQIIAQGPPDEITQCEDERVHKLISASDKTAIGEIAEDEAAAPKRAPEQTPSAAEEGADKSDRSDRSGPAKRGEDEPHLELVAPGGIAVKVEDLHKKFDEAHVLKGINLEVPEHKITVLIGGSGSGKSVLMKHFLGLFQPTSGRVEVYGQDMATIEREALTSLRSQIGMLFQHAALLDSMSVADNIAFPLVERRRKVPADEVKERVAEVMEQLKLSEFADKMPMQISNGQQKRVSLARAIVTRPKMMIYDEPTTGQDPIMCAYVEEMIVEAHEQFNLTSVIISHDMASTFRIGDHVAMLYKGEIIAAGEPRSLLKSEDERVREFVFAADVADAKRDAS